VHIAPNLTAPLAEEMALVQTVEDLISSASQGGIDRAAVEQRLGAPRRVERETMEGFITATYAFRVEGTDSSPHISLRYAFDRLLPESPRLYGLSEAATRNCSESCRFVGAPAWLALSED